MTDDVGAAVQLAELLLQASDTSVAASAAGADADLPPLLRLPSCDAFQLPAIDSAGALFRRDGSGVTTSAGLSPSSSFTASHEGPPPPLALSPGSLGGGVVSMPSPGSMAIAGTSYSNVARSPPAGVGLPPQGGGSPGAPKLPAIASPSGAAAAVAVAAAAAPGGKPLLPAAALTGAGTPTAPGAASTTTLSRRASGDLRDSATRLPAVRTASGTSLSSANTVAALAAAPAPAAVMQAPTGHLRGGSLSRNGPAGMPGAEPSASLLPSSSPSSQRHLAGGTSAFSLGGGGPVPGTSPELPLGGSGVNGAASSHDVGLTPAEVVTPDAATLVVSGPGSVLMALRAARRHQCSVLTVQDVDYAQLAEALPLVCQMPKLTELVLLRIAGLVRLQQLEPLAAASSLSSLQVSGSPVADTPLLALYVAHRLPVLDLVNGGRITPQLRESARAIFLPVKHIVTEVVAGSAVQQAAISFDSGVVAFSGPPPTVYATTPPQPTQSAPSLLQRWQNLSVKAGDTAGAVGSNVPDAYRTAHMLTRQVLTEASDTQHALEMCERVWPEVMRGVIKEGAGIPSEAATADASAALHGFDLAVLKRAAQL